MRMVYHDNAVGVGVMLMGTASCLGEEGGTLNVVLSVSLNVTLNMILIVILTNPHRDPAVTVDWSSM